MESFFVHVPKSFFSFLLPGILYSINLGKIKSKSHQIKNLIFIFIAFSIFIVLVVYINNIFEKGVKQIAEVINLIFGWYFYYNQKDDFKKWKEKNIKNRSLVLPIILACIPLAIFIAYMLSDPLTKTASYKPSEDTLYYDKSIDLIEIKALYQLLSDKEYYIKDDHKIDTVLEDNKEYYTFISFFEKETFSNDELIEIKKDFENIVNDSKVLKKKVAFSPRTPKWKKIMK